MAIKMIVTDLDGTLLNTQNTISEKNKAAFKKAKEKGIIPVVATGRIDKEGWFAAEAIGGTDYMPVSYTHLDVYKRQLPAYLRISVLLNEVST